MAGERTNLNLEEIRSYLNEGYDQKEIASFVGVHRNTLSVQKFSKRTRFK